MLRDKVGVIYGAGGTVGGAEAQAFARERAKLFLTGRHRASIAAVAKVVASAGGWAGRRSTRSMNAPCEGHLQSVIDKAGRVDISFNAIGIPNTTLQGVPLVELDVGQFSLPIATYTRSHFLTARVAARRMVAQRSEMIMTVTAVPSRADIPPLGGFAPAHSAVECLTPGLSAELAPHGIRVAHWCGEG